MICNLLQVTSNDNGIRQISDQSHSTQTFGPISENKNMRRQPQLMEGAADIGQFRAYRGRKRMSTEVTCLN